VWRRAKHCGEYGRRYKQYLGSGTWTQKHLHLLKAGGSKRVGRYHVDSWSNASQIDLGLIESRGGKEKQRPAGRCMRPQPPPATQVQGAQQSHSYTSLTANSLYCSTIASVALTCFERPFRADVRYPIYQCNLLYNQGYRPCSQYQRGLLYCCRRDMLCPLLSLVLSLAYIPLVVLASPPCGGQ
jgi:hypothetical protein